MPRRIVIGVGIANYPIAAAGNSWAFLQWLLAFRAAGWEVWAVEELKSSKCINQNREVCDPASSVNVSYWKKFLSEFNLFENSTLFIDGKAENKNELLKFARSADFLLNISGHFRDPEVLAGPRYRLYLDIDPAFTQIWSEAYNADINLQGHDFFLTVGSQLGDRDCIAPTLNKKWIHTFPPVDLTYWNPKLQEEPGKTWTTVTHWYGYSAVEYQNEWYGNKTEEFEKIISLPSLVKDPFEIATDLAPEAVEYKSFTDIGWKFCSSAPISDTWQHYRRYLAQSRGEFCVAKNGYVKSNCGWFSDRSVCYLALGRPVVLQETGWSKSLPTGEGLFAFKNAEEAAMAINQISIDYKLHSLAARKLAETYFSGQFVAERLAEKISRAIA